MIRVESRDAIAILRLEHGKVNAIDAELFAELIEKLTELETSGSRAVVFTGGGSNFSAGVDLFRVVQGGAAYLRDFIPLLTEGLLKLFTFPKPVVAAVNGHAIAGGCILACACDYRLMARGPGLIGVAELTVGVPFPSLPLEVMRFVLPPRHFQHLIYFGKTVQPEDALRFGFVDELVDPDALLTRACELAETLAAIPGDSFALTKKLMRQPVLERYQRFHHGNDPEALKIWASPENLKRLAAYLQKVVGQGKK